MQPQQAARLFGGHRVPRLPEDGIGHQPAAHANAAVDGPNGQLDAHRRHGFVPGQDVLIDAVHQGAVQVEEEGRSARRQAPARGNC
jgi:hypothetical protein